MNQREEILSYGVTFASEEGYMFKGLGYVFDQHYNIVYEGEFVQNHLHGEGTK